VRIRPSSVDTGILALKVSKILNLFYNFFYFFKFLTFAPMTLRTILESFGEDARHELGWNNVAGCVIFK
jgi:hypothetical protein